MSLNPNNKDLCFTRTGDLCLSIPQSGNLNDIVISNNKENDLLMQKIALRLSTKRSEWGVGVSAIPPSVNLDMFLGQPLNDALVESIISKIYFAFTYDGLIDAKDFVVMRKLINKTECYIAIKISPRNNPNFTKALLLSYDSNTNSLTPTVIDYIEK
ncbi:hypothetical protein UFOVP724_157 [uncultured Caudovirales phage]|uniref:Uncharacterized protein n=1 Tax=uncultured Caudovirales phage TaxID=2100421 RepID=A0A6J5NN72_9CAUD|nr:hypothetical protein UFOVP724_157 [uncultured Caudovirales phage]